jgi:hypothetical protein
MPGMMPQQSSSTPSAEIARYNGLSLPQLTALFQRQPSGVLLRKITDALEVEKTRKAQEGQNAMAAAAQQTGTVKDDVMAAAAAAQTPIMAASGGIMQGYAGGGAVAFRRGGDVQHFSDGSKEFGVLSDPEAYALDALRSEQEQNKQKVRDLENSYYYLLSQNDPRAAQVKQQLDTLSGRPSVIARPAPAPVPVMSPEAQALTNRQGPRGNMAADRPRVAQPTATTFDITNPASINALRMAAQDTSLPEAERADLQRRIAMMEGNRPAQSGVASLAKPQANLTPEEEQYFANKASTLRTRQGLPEDVLAGRQGIATLAAENLAAQRAEREQMAREAKEQRDAALAKAQRSIMDDPMSLLALAGSIDTRRGQGVGSLARGAAGLMGKREEQAEAARKEFALAQRDQRMLQANERQANMLEMQRQQAIRENDVPRVSQIEDQLAALEVQKSQLLRSRQEHAEKMALEGRKVGAMEAEATAKLGRETILDLFIKDPKKAREYLTMSAEAQAAGRGPQTAGDRQDLAELKALQGNLQKQIENYVLPKGVRDAAAAQLQQVNAKLAQMAGLDGAPTPTGGVVTPKSQAEFNALPKGARYINPADGEEYIKN